MFDTTKVLNLITINDDFFKFLLKRNPTIEKDLISFKLNPGCVCKANIQKHLDENIAEQSIIENWISLNVNDESTPIFNMTRNTMNQLKLDKIRMVLKPSLPQSEWKNFKDVIGETVEIEPNPDKYKELMAIAREKWFYNGLNVLETIKTNTEDGSDKIIWLVFFY